MEFRDGPEDDEEPVGPLLPPDDRLWRHPSEIAGHPVAARVSHRRVPEPRLLMIAGLAGLTGALLATGMSAAVGGFRNRTVIRNTPVERVQEFPPVTTSVSDTRIGDNSGTGGDAADVVAIAKEVRPAIVQVVVAGETSGSGVIYRSDGLVLTNQHVVGSAPAARVLLADGREFDTEVIGTDTDTDIAVLRIASRTDGDTFPTALLGTATRLEAGQTAIAVGSPLGLSGGPSITVGVVSALGREVPRAGSSLLDMIQFDAPIAPGSSGGALVDSSGAVIGITTAIAVSDVGAEGLGFATPIDIARMVADQLVTNGHAVHVWLGIEGEDLDAITAERLALAGGATVRGVRGGSPAEAAGVRAADVIVAVNSTPVRTMGSLVVALRGYSPGDVVTLTVNRDGRLREVKVILREAPRS